MKRSIVIKKCLVLTALLWSMVNLDAQSKWFTDDAEWIYSYNSFFEGGLVGYEKIKVEGEIEIEGRIYKVLNKKVFRSDFMDYSSLMKEEEVLVYEEENRVYKFDNYKSILLYDFNLGVGDTSRLESFNGFNFKVDSIGVFESTGNRVQHITIWNPNNNALIGSVEIVEFVGAIFPSFFPSSWNNLIAIDLPYGSLHCFSDNKASFDLGKLDIECSSIFPTNTNLHSISDVKIFPNPFSDNLSFDLGSIKVEKITITDITGRQMATKHSGFQEIQLGNLAAGVYVASISLNNGEVFQYKLIKN